MILYFIGISKHFNFTWEQIEQAYMDKNKVNHHRQKEAIKKDGEIYRKIEYVVDFEIHNLESSIEIIDVKGAETKAFLLKK